MGKELDEKPKNMKRSMLKQLIASCIGLCAFRKRYRVHFCPHVSRMTRAMLAIVALGFLALPAFAHAQRRDIKVSQRLRLASATNGIDGALEVLTDSRLTDELKQDMWGIGDWGFVRAFVLPEGDPRRAVFERKPPRNAELRIVTNTNQVLQRVVLERPLARVTESHILGSKISFLVAVDYSVGFGSYAGVTTLLLDVADGQFRWAEAKDVNTQRIEPIRLADTLKSAWKLVPFRGYHDILGVYCRPNFQVDNEFFIEYERYRFNGKQWAKYERRQKGYWESDQPFPPLSKFPSR